MPRPSAGAAACVLPLLPMSADSSHCVRGDHPAPCQCRAILRCYCYPGGANITRHINTDINPPPPGITCPAVQITSTDNPISVICTAPQATGVLTAGLRGATQAADTSAAEQAAQVYADAVDSSAEPAVPEAAVQVASQASVASSQHARVAQQQLPGSTQYTLTATVTADAVAEADAQVKVGMQRVWHVPG